MDAQSARRKLQNVREHETSASGWPSPRSSFGARCSKSRHQRHPCTCLGLAPAPHVAFPADFPSERSPAGLAAFLLKSIHGPFRRNRQRQKSRGSPPFSQKPMRLNLELGELENNLLEFSFNQLLGTSVVKVNHEVI